VLPSAVSGEEMRHERTSVATQPSLEAQEQISSVVPGELHQERTNAVAQAPQDLPAEEVSKPV